MLNLMATDKLWPRKWILWQNACHCELPIQCRSRTTAQFALMTPAWRVVQRGECKKGHYSRRYCNDIGLAFISRIYGYSQTIAVN